MTVIKINDTTDVLIKNKNDFFDSLSPLQQVEYIEKINRLHEIKRLAKKQRTSRK